MNNKDEIMSLMPAIKLGLWNAWIFVLLGLLIGYMSWVFINTEALKKYRTEPDVPKTRIEKSSERIFFNSHSLAWSARAFGMPLTGSPLLA